MSNEFDSKRTEMLFKRLAEHLGITEDELEQLSPEYDANASDDGLVYGYIVKFSQESPPAILAKVRGLEDGRYWIEVGPNFFDINDDSIHPDADAE